MCGYLYVYHACVDVFACVDVYEDVGVDMDMFSVFIQKHLYVGVQESV